MFKSLVLQSTEIQYILFSTDQFRSRNVCEGERIKLNCKPNSRIAIFDAQYGRTKFEATRCPQPKGVSDESKY